MIMKITVSALLTLTLTACTSLPAVKPNAGNTIKSVAFMPMVNHTNDLDGPVLLRSLLGVQFEKFFYSVKPLDESDRILKDHMGITLGSQLDMASTRQLCDALGVDGIVFSSLDDFNQKILGVYNVKRVRVRAKLENCTSSETVWKNGIGVKRETRAADSLLKKVPVIGTAVTAVGVLSSVLSSQFDKTDTELTKLHGETIPAPWEDISEGNSSAEANLALELGSKIMDKTQQTPLLSEAGVAVEILMRGYYDDGAEIIPYGMAVPPGPVMTMVNESPK